MAWRAVILCLVLLASCRDDSGDGGNGEPTEAMEYFCDVYSQRWCTAFRMCDESRFNQTFRSFTECVDQVEHDCLIPPEGHDACRGVTQEEADACAAYIEGNIPDGCSNLFGHGSDMSPCEDDICD
jgi:hypothetical protein